MKLVSIIIPTLGKEDYVEKCVKSIRDKVKRDDYEIIVVDDGGEKEDHDKLAKLSKELDFVLVTNAENSGFGSTIRLGLTTAGSTSFKLFLNDDTEADNDFITAMLDRYQGTPKCGVVGAKLLYPNRTIQFAGHVRNPYSPKWFDHLHRGQAEDFLIANKARKVIGITGACFLVHEHVLKAVEEEYGHYGFDPRYVMAFEDIDFCFKVRKLGYDCWYEPAAVVIHKEGGTRGVSVEPKAGPNQMLSLRAFWDFWTEEDVDELSKLAF